MQPNCTVLDASKGFQEYTYLLRNETADNITVSAMLPCRQQICRILYGTGNADVSGIGVIVGYFVEFGFAFLLAAISLALHKRTQPALAQCIRRITSAYADSATMLALSVELASAIMLLKKNFGVGISDFGNLTVEITWLVSILVILPTVVFCWQDLDDDRIIIRLCAAAVTFVLFLTTFISRMVNSYSQGQIGTGPNDVMSPDEADQLSQLCFNGPFRLSSSPETFVEVFSITGSLWALCTVIAALVLYSFDEVKIVASTRHWLLDPQRQFKVVATFMGVMTILSCPLYWALLAMRSRQTSFAESLGVESGSNVWSFGQIMAVVVFLPVLTEGLQQYLESGKDQSSNLGGTASSGNEVVEK